MTSDFREAGAPPLGAGLGAPQAAAPLQPLTKQRWALGGVHDPPPQSLGEERDRAAVEYGRHNRGQPACQY